MNKNMQQEIKSYQATTLEAKLKEINQIDISEWENCFLIDKEILKDFNPEKEFLCSGYGVVWNNIDKDGDVMDMNSFDDILPKIYNREKTVKYLYQHQRNESPIGSVVALKKDNYGLKYLVLGFKVGKGAEMHAHLEGQQKYNLDGYIANSFNFKVQDEERMIKNGVEIRVIKKVKDFDEISLVTYPANDKAKFDKITKSENQDMKTCGTMSRLRKALMKTEGLSNRKAQELVEGFAKGIAIKEMQKQSYIEEKNQLQQRINELEIQIKSREETPTLGIPEEKSFIESILPPFKLQEKTTDSIVDFLIKKSS